VEWLDKNIRLLLNRDAYTKAVSNYSRMLDVSRRVLVGSIDAGFVKLTRGRRNEFRFSFCDVHRTYAAEALESSQTAFVHRVHGYPSAPLWGRFGTARSRTRPQMKMGTAGAKAATVTHTGRTSMPVTPIQTKKPNRQAPKISFCIFPTQMKIVGNAVVCRRAAFTPEQNAFPLFTRRSKLRPSSDACSPRVAICPMMRTFRLSGSREESHIQVNRSRKFYLRSAQGSYFAVAICALTLTGGASSWNGG
jgi:hypothetical protein